MNTVYSNNNLEEIIYKEGSTSHSLNQLVYRDENGNDTVVFAKTIPVTIRIEYGAKTLTPKFKDANGTEVLRGNPPFDGPTTEGEFTEYQINCKYGDCPGNTGMTAVLPPSDHWAHEMGEMDYSAITSSKTITYKFSRYHWHYIATHEADPSPGSSGKLYYKVDGVDYRTDLGAAGLYDSEGKIHVWSRFRVGSHVKMDRLEIYKKGTLIRKIQLLDEWPSIITGSSTHYVNLDHYPLLI